MDIKKDIEIIKYLYNEFFRKYLKDYIYIIIMMTVATLFSLIEPTLNIKLFDEVLPKKDYYYLIKIVAVYAMITVLTLLINYFVQKKSTQLDNTITVNIKENIMKKIYATLSEQSNEKRSDEIVTMTQDVQVVSGFFNGTVVGTILSLGNVLMVTCYMIYYSTIFTIIVFINIAIQIYIASKYAIPLRENYNKRKQNSEEEIGILSSTLANLKLLKVYNSEEKNQSKYNSILHRFKQIKYESFKIGFSQSALLSIISALGVIVIILLGTKLIISGYMTVGILVAFIGLSDNVKNSMSYLLSLNASLQGMTVSSRRVFNCLDTTDEFEKNIAEHKNISIEQIEARHMNLYISDKTLLKDISFKLEKGQAYIITGNNGVGKSTLFNSLLKFNLVGKQMLFINNSDINLIGAREVRDRISVVLQKNYFLQGSIKENIMLAKPDFDLNELGKLLNLVYLREFMNSLKEGFETKMDDLNTVFSAGELQKISILRALVKDADVYLFDEPFSNLDVNIKVNMYKNICNHLKEKIVVFITHDSEVINAHDGNILHINDENVLLNDQSQI